MQKTVAEYLELFRRYTHAYYNTGEPLVPDSEFDRLKEEFKELYPDHAYFKEIGAPAAVDSNFRKVAHEIPMGSLDKATDESEFRKFGATAAVDGMYCVSEKIDGLSVSITYWGGTLRQAVTRGDGIYGDDITRNVLLMQVPRFLPVKITATFRGEIFMKKSVFQAKHATIKANPRNAAVGIAKRLDGAGCEDLSIYFYNLLSEMAFTNENQKFQYIQNTLKLPTPFYKKASLEEVVRIHEAYESDLREKVDYEIDGLVATVDQLSRQEYLGEADRYPKYAIAYKFGSQEGRSTVLDIVDQTGRTGAVTPVALIVPVQVAGVTISRVTLHNYAEIARLGLRIGSDVVVKRSGDVIPKITQVLSGEKGTVKLPPTNCPSCDGPLEFNDIQVKCKNVNCTARTTKGLVLWLEKLNVMNFGEKLVEQLEERGILNEPADFYKLQPEQIANIEGRGQVIAMKVLNELQEKKSVTLDVFLAALSINGLADKTAKLLVGHYGNLDKILNATEEDLLNIQGIGEEKAEAIVRGLADKRPALEAALKCVTMVHTEKQSDKLAGKTFCFTGFRDKSLEQQIEANGGKVTSSVSAKLTYLCVDGNKPSSKQSKAEQLGVKVLQKEELEDMLRA